MVTFSYGQVVRSIATGEVYVVRRWPDELVSLKTSRSYHARHTGFELIGNNFNPKISLNARRDCRYLRSE